MPSRLLASLLILSLLAGVAFAAGLMIAVLVLRRLRTPPLQTGANDRPFS